MQGFLHPLHHSVWIIAIIAQMPQHHMIQFGMRHRLQQLRCLIIGKMPMSRADALLGRPWTLRVRIEQLRIVVRLDEEAVAATQPIFDQISDAAHIAEHTEAGFLIRDHKAHRIDRIMLHGEALNSQISQLKGATRRHHLPCRTSTEFQAAQQCFLRERCRIQAEVTFAAQDLQCAGVILMLMREQDTIKLI